MVQQTGDVFSYKKTFSNSKTIMCLVGKLSTNQLGSSYIAKVLPCFRIQNSALKWTSIQNNINGRVILVFIVIENK